MAAGANSAAVPGAATALGTSAIVLATRLVDARAATNLFTLFLFVDVHPG
jgi:hypothetical protein